MSVLLKIPTPKSGPWAGAGPGPAALETARRHGARWALWIDAPLGRFARPMLGAMGGALRPLGALKSARGAASGFAQKMLRGRAS